MIKINVYGSCPHTEYVSTGAIASVKETATSSQWHGIRSRIKLFDGEVIESGDDAAYIVRMIEAAKQEGLQ